MKRLKEILVGIGFLISGVLGVSIGNLELTLNTARRYRHSVSYLLFAFFIIVGLIFIIMGLMKKDD
ncbi:hypothetical protein [Clostridium sp.]|jgi:uncharacterized membrane protein YidH (DUF202 family)|uniref:hypothetical protein n=1 Tax=Clostridium sp. TaxID=1506 RepID=UPI003EE8330A